MDNRETDYRRWRWEKWGRRCVRNLKQNGFEALWADDAGAARELVLAQIGEAATVGVGGSDTVRRIGVVDALRERGKTVYDHWSPGLSDREIHKIRLDQGRADVFLCSANAIARTGEIVNVDGVGNRTAAMSFGPPRVVIVAGMNKVTADLPSALDRVRNVAAPMRARSLNMDTPCAETGICQECQSPQRICRITTILHRRPLATAVTVVLVGQTLGF